MRASEIRELSDQELAVKERDLKESLFRFRLKRGINQLESPAAMKSTRRELARVKTVMAQRQVGEKQGKGR
jgi:large subunit ribosomal protein L29